MQQEDCSTYCLGLISVRMTDTNKCIIGVRIWSCDLVRAELIPRFIQLLFTCWVARVLPRRSPVQVRASAVLYRAVPGTREFGLVYIQRTFQYRDIQRERESREILS